MVRNSRSKRGGSSKGATPIRVPSRHSLWSSAIEIGSFYKKERPKNYSFSIQSPNGDFKCSFPPNTDFNTYLLRAIRHLLEAGNVDDGLRFRINQALAFQSKELSSFSSAWDANFFADVTDVSELMERADVEEEETSQEEAAKSYILKLPKSKTYQLVILGYKEYLSKSIEQAIKNATCAPDRAIEDILSNQKEFTLPAERAKALYIQLRKIGAVSIIRKPGDERKPALSASEKKKLVGKNNTISRMFLPKKISSEAEEIFAKFDRQSVDADIYRKQNYLAYRH